MPNGDDKIPERARKAAEMSKERGRLALQISDPAERRMFIEEQGRLEGSSMDPTGTTRLGYAPSVEGYLKAQNREVARRAQRNGRRR
jgi:hypothetical protein